MKINVNPKEGLLINAFLLMFIIHTVQTGVGIVGLPRIIFLESEQDAWISVLLSSFFMIAVVTVIYVTLRQYPSADLYGVQYDIFGKWLGGLFNTLYICYLFLAFFTIGMDYTEMIQAWIFSTLPTWVVMALLLILTIYGVLGGIRVIAGVAFMSFTLSFWITFILYSPFKLIIWTHYFPVWDHSLKEIAMGTFKTSLSILGFEMLYFVFPYIKEKKKALKYSIFAVLYTTILFSIITFTSIGFFSFEGLKVTIWPVLSMFKIVRVPNLERFEFIAISFWMLIILPNLCFYYWAATRGLKRVFNMNQRYSVYFMAIIIWIISFFFSTRLQINKISDFTGDVGIALVLIYPFILFLLVMLKKKILKR
ncbi:GerAB/ArcD/ProY family transporter [Bacillus sp. 2205SS5-2]|uniref:GerAB/ArcD/ProY family transporter n=1 Tax=Bacillus sp. 2205SS5-2 TaxID=3109031 RepID=UPI003006FB09